MRSGGNFRIPSLRFLLPPPPPIKTLPHQIAVTNRRHSIQGSEIGVFINHNADIQNALEASRRTTDLEGSERRGLGTVIRSDDVTEKETDSTDKRITETACGVDLDGDGGGIAGKKLRRDAEEKLVVPGGVVAADGVETGAEAV